MIMDEYAEATSDKRFFVIVTLVSDNVIKKKIQNWHQNEPKRNKIGITYVR